MVLVTLIPNPPAMQVLLNHTQRCCGPGLSHPLPLGVQTHAVAVTEQAGVVLCVCGLLLDKDPETCLEDLISSLLVRVCSPICGRSVIPERCQDEDLVCSLPSHSYPQKSHGCGTYTSAMTPG